jgi:plasmid stability protein
MRTTIDLPQDTLRQLKAQAALQGTTLKEIVRRLVQQGLAAEKSASASAPAKRTKLPSVNIGRALKIPNLSNATLMELIDE